MRETSNTPHGSGLLDHYRRQSEERQIKEKVLAQQGKPKSYLPGANDEYLPLRVFKRSKGVVLGAPVASLFLLTNHR
jgi:hypothetical protein